MKMIRTFYYYLFYRFYKLSELAPSRWWSEGKAGAALTIIIIIVLFTVLQFYSFITYKDIIPEKNGKLIVGFIAGFIGLTNYFIFAHNNQWKSIVLHFDDLPKQKLRIGEMFFWIFIVGVLVSFIYVFYVLDWQHWREVNNGK
jgi:hypothetical protein